jgi:hypothetical protein
MLSDFGCLYVQDMLSLQFLVIHENINHLIQVSYPLDCILCLKFEEMWVEVDIGSDQGIVKICSN